MRENLPFDDYVKKQFSNYTPDVPAHIWNNIVANRRSKPKGFWMNIFSRGNLLILAVVLFIAGGTSYLLFYANNKPLAKNIGTEKVVPSPQTVTILSGTKLNERKPTNLSDQSVVPEEENTDIIPNVSSINSSNTSDQNNLFASPSGKNYIRKTDEDETNKNELTVVQNTNEVIRPSIFSPFNITNARELSGAKILNYQNLKLPECPALEKNAAANKKYWEVYAGPDHAFESYKSYGDTASNNYLQRRKASTKFASAFSAGVRYTKVFNNGTSVRAGVNYTQVNEKFSYFNPNEIKNVTVITTRVIIRSPGDTIYINDTLQYQQTGTRIKTTYNRYRNLDIPLLFGYELGNGKLHANINAGVIINIYSWYKGDVLDTLYQPVTITTGKGSSAYQFKNNIGVGFLGSVSVYYKINDKLHLILEPYFRYNLSPMSKNNLNLQQKYHIAGVRTGVRFDLK